MIRRIRDLVGLNATGPSTKSLLDVRPRQVQVQPAMLETSQEIAVYVHRFHNLDLFQQGWYQIKISTRWEDEIHGFPGTPARVVQYEVPDLGIDDNSGVWMIDDIDHSFSTQPFHVKYSRQDVLLSVMVSFNLALPRYEICPSASAVILKFELLYAPMLGNGFELQTSVELSPASVHEFRIPPIALLGLHTYCPVHFDAFHSVLIDLSVHTVLLKTGSISPSRKTHKGDDIGGYTEQNQIYQKDYGGSTIPTLIKALSTSRDILLEELQRLSKAIDPALDVLSDIDSNSSGVKKVDSSTDTLNRRKSQITNNIEREGPGLLSSEDLVEMFHSLGTQLSVTWNAFLNFHRANRTKILEYLYDIWANDRRTEWSIWMVHSVIDIPHRYLKSGDESLHQSLSGRHSISRKSNDDQPHIATMRADLHRRSIAQMKINNRFIQDMQIFGDPSRIPVILVEQNVTNLSSQSVIELELKETLMRQMESCTKPLFKLKHVTPRKNNRVLRAAVFVHGFQGHHLDLRLVRNQWLLIDPGADCLMSMANEDRTSDDFREMGNRLAEEVASFLKKKMDKASRSGGYKNIKLSFVGHSIGNIIIRSCLTESIMEPFLKYLYTYVSISGPHLGYLYSSNSLFNSGLWLLKKLKGAPCIHQLTFTDDPDLQNTFFYQLCKKKTLENFKNILLLSSPQDGYVPYHSARIQLCQTSSLDYSKRGQIFTEMLNNCLDQIRAPSSEGRIFMRCDVNFDISTQGMNLNTIIGRAAHIEFLETDIFARFIMWSFPKIFL